MHEVRGDADPALRFALAFIPTHTSHLQRRSRPNEALSLVAANSSRNAFLSILPTLVFGKFRPKIDVLGNFVARQRLAAVIYHVLLSEFGILAHDKERHNFTGMLVRLRYRRGLENPGMRDRDGLRPHLDRR